MSAMDLLFGYSKRSIHFTVVQEGGRNVQRHRHRQCCAYTFLSSPPLCSEDTHIPAISPYSFYSLFPFSSRNDLCLILEGLNELSNNIYLLSL